MRITNKTCGICKMAWYNDGPETTCIKCQWKEWFNEDWDTSKCPEHFRHTIFRHYLKFYGKHTRFGFANEIEKLAKFCDVESIKEWLNTMQAFGLHWREEIWNKFPMLVVKYETP